MKMDETILVKQQRIELLKMVNKITTSTLKNKILLPQNSTDIII
jgi:hypothetical protein